MIDPVTGGAVHHSMTVVLLVLYSAPNGAAGYFRPHSRKRADVGVLCPRVHLRVYDHRDDFDLRGMTCSKRMLVNAGKQSRGGHTVAMPCHPYASSIASWLHDS